MIRGFLARSFGDDRSRTWLGAADCLLHRQQSTGFGGPLNGSAARLATFQELNRLRPFDAIVETGTYRGESTNFFSSVGCPVYTSEVNPRYLGYAKARLWRRSNVHFCLGDSRQFLRGLIQDSSVPKERVFFYLDAHWEEDLPLREEVEVIFRNWVRPLVMVDDFQIPDDSGYHFDDYGVGKKLSLEYLEPVAHLGFTPFFPTLPSSEEVGYKRGWVVLASDGSSIDELRGIARLREWRSPDA
jgi:hypothetical protein